jgi:hypothetical protein
MVGEELARQAAQRGRDGLFVRRLGQHQCPQEVVVDPGRFEHRQGDKGRPQQWANDRAQRADARRTVDARRLEDLVRQRLQERRQHERAEAKLETDG